MKRIGSFLKALLRHWWLLLFSVLSSISTASTYLPQLHIPKLLPFGIALVLVFVAAYRAYSDQCDVLASVRKEGDQIASSLDKSEETRRALQGELKAAEQANAQFQQEKESAKAESRRLESVISGLQIQILDLNRRPYDEQKLTRTRVLIAPLRYIERDILRLLVLNGDCRGDVFYHQRVKMTDTFDANGHIKPLREAGFVQVIEDHLSGFSTYKLNQSNIEPLKDLLFPRNEGDNAPFFKGL